MAFMDSGDAIKKANLRFSQALPPKEEAKAPSALPEVAKSDEEEDDNTSIWAKLALGLGPAVVGYLAGGSEGAASGGSIGASTISSLMKDAEEKRKKRMEAAAEMSKEKRTQDFEREMTREKQSGAEKLERIKAGLKDKDEKDFTKRYVPGVGIALTEDDAKKLKEAALIKESMDGDINTLIKMRTDMGGGTWTDRDALSKAQSISNKILLKYKTLAGLGVLSAKDEDILNKIIPSNPLEKNLSGLANQDPTMVRLQELQKSVNDEYNMNLGLRLQIPDAPKPKDKNVLDIIGISNAMANESPFDKKKRLEGMSPEQRAAYAKQLQDMLGGKP